MKRSARLIIFRATVALCAVWLILGGCAKRPRPPESLLGTPEHHGFSGFKLIKKERLDDARREFEIALELDPKYLPAYRGIGLVYGKKKQFDSAFESMRLARDYATKREDKALAIVGFMRLRIMKKDEGWIAEVENNFNLASSIMKDLPEAFYFMGIAYKEGYQFTDAKKALQRVLEINRGLTMEADMQLKILQKIELARPESEFGKRISLMDRITRADVAALFIRELRFDRIHKKSRPGRGDTPERASGEGPRGRPRSMPIDVEDHPLKTDIEEILQLDIQGLRTFPDGTFAPDQYITQASYAIMIADLIAKIENDASLATKYIGSRSPFKDVYNKAPYFNAIMVCTDRGGIMEARNGYFRPMRKISGADALLIIRRLKEEFGIF